MPGAFLYEPNSGILDMNYESSYESIGLRRGKLVKNKKSILRISAHLHLAAAM